MSAELEQARAKSPKISGTTLLEAQFGLLNKILQNYTL